jgi:RNA polymerase sigma factor (sigma-70 family)
VGAHKASVRLKTWDVNYIIMLVLVPMDGPRRSLPNCAGIKWLMVKTQLKPGWAPTQGAFRDLLNWLDEGAESSGEKYLEMHRRLAAYFARKNCLSPDDLADETLTRVLRRLEEVGAIADMPAARYCYITARFVFLEYLRRAEHRQISLDALPGSRYPASGLAAPSDADDEFESRAKRLDCLEHCLLKLTPDHRELISEYYQGERQAKIEGRRQLAARLGLTMNALTIRACRIREKLEACVRTALGAEG